MSFLFRQERQKINRFLCFYISIEIPQDKMNNDISPTIAW